MAPLFDEELSIKSFLCFDSPLDNLYFMLYLGSLQCETLRLKNADRLDESRKLTRRIMHLKRSRKTLEIETRKFCIENEINFDDNGTCMEKFTNAASSLFQIRIQLYTRIEKPYRYLLQEDLNKDADCIIYLALLNDKFNLMNLTQKSIGSRFCKNCLIPVANMRRHYCKKCCRKCGRLECDGVITGNDTISCDTCLFLFYNMDCFIAHRQCIGKSTRSKCNSVRRCRDCGIIHNITDSSKVHVCGQTYFCNICKFKVDPNFHDCCWRPIGPRSRDQMMKKQSKYKIVFFDFETVIIDEDRQFCKQWVNLICWTSICESCIEKHPYSTCNACGASKYGSIRHQRSQDKNTVVDTFLDLLLFDSRYKNAILLSHNGSRFDQQFILERIIDRGITPKVVMKGTSIILLEIDLKDGQSNHIIFKDSYLFLPMSLSMLPSAFSLSEKIKKGTFPYYFNQIINYSKVFDNLPAPDEYGVKYMTVKNRKEFDEWYSVNKYEKFDFDYELLEYCKNDVLILHLSVVKFITMGMQLYKLNPIILSSTLPSYTFKIIKLMYKKDQVSILPENGFLKDNQSGLAVRFIQWLNETTDNQYKYSLNGGEHVIQVNSHRYKVDGYAERSRDVLEVLGDFYHGNLEVFHSEKPHPLYKNKTMGEVHADTMRRIRDIEKAGFNVTYFWEKDINTMLINNPIMRQFFNDRAHLGPLRIRDSYHGGRTQPLKLRCTANVSKGERIIHLDVNSLFPYCMRTFQMGIGSPKVLTSFEGEVTLPLPFRGFVKCTVLPPSYGLLHPVIPWSSPDGKLLFPLCRSCAIEKRNAQCNHTDYKQRVLHLTLYTGELELALKNNYRCLQVFEVYHWDVWSNEMLRSFLNPLQKLKMESSGWPSYAITDEKKDEYIQTVFNEEGILLEKNKVCKNNPMRTLSKFMCNASYGKLAEKSDRTSVEFIHADDDRIWKLLGNDTIEITNQKIFQSGIVMIGYRTITDAIQPTKYTNVSYASIITSEARMVLWKSMNKLGDNLCYVDTDSCIFKAYPGSEQLENERGEWLGKWSVDHDESYEIFDFCSAASKVYSYRMRHKDTGEVKEIVKTRGVTLDVSSAELLKFSDVAKLVDNLIHGDGSMFIETSRPVILRKDMEVRTVQIGKKTKVVMDKVWYRNDYSTRPYGFCEHL